MPSMTDTGTQKEWWNIAECVVWICTRNSNSVAAMRDMNAEEAIRHTMLGYGRGWRATPRRPPSGMDTVAGCDSTGESEAKQGTIAAADAQHGSLPASVPREGGSQEEPSTISSEPSAEPVESFDIEPVVPKDAIVMTSDQALEDLLCRLPSGRIKIMGRKVGGSDFEQIQSFELVDLSFRIVPGHSEASIGLWMPARNSIIWTSVQCLRADVVVDWRAQQTKTIAVR